MIIFGLYLLIGFCFGVGSVIWNTTHYPNDSILFNIFFFTFSTLFWPFQLTIMILEKNEVL